MVADKSLATEIARILIEEVDRAKAIRIVERIEDEAGEFANHTARVTLDRVMAALVNASRAAIIADKRRRAT